MKPTLFLDVDGVINAFQHHWTDDLKVKNLYVVAHTGEEYLLKIPESVPEYLNELKKVYTIVWATTWQNANSAISPLVGLPKNLSKIIFPNYWTDISFDFGRKIPYIRHYAFTHGIKNLVWLDDDISRKDEKAFRKDWNTKSEYSKGSWRDLMVQSNGIEVDNLKFLQTNPRTGITKENLEELLDFAKLCRKSS